MNRPRRRAAAQRSMNIIRIESRRRRRLVRPIGGRAQVHEVHGPTWNLFAYTEAELLNARANGIPISILVFFVRNPDEPAVDPQNAAELAPQLILPEDLFARLPDLSAMAERNHREMVMFILRRRRRGRL
ncbi:unnamed protein product [Caenorhabditis sp. 36 PRJEB53466]|nr:unnamed protein product [Caenorhabditis sp. 36 PRJEB53466]